MIRGLWFAATIGCTANEQGPRLDSAVPSMASRGATVMLIGHRLCGGDCVHAGGQVQIGLENPTQAMIVSYADTMAQIVVPPVAPIGMTQVVVTVNDQASNALPFEVLP